MAQDGGESAPRRGRPRGLSARGDATRERLYRTAIGLIASRGWHETTLRDVAADAGVSVGLLYRYFPSKRAIVLRLYDELSDAYAARAAAMEDGPWRDRFLFALRTSLDVLKPQRTALGALTPVLVGDGEDSVLAPGTAFSRQRVAQVFLNAVNGATDAPRPEVAAALGRLLYLLHLAIILWWLLDTSPAQRATDRLIALLGEALPLLAFGLRLRRVRTMVITADAIVRDALGDVGADSQARRAPVVEAP